MKNNKEVIVLDIERMNKALKSEKIVMPANLSREEKRKYILSYANKDTK